LCLQCFCFPPRIKARERASASYGDNDARGASDRIVPEIAHLLKGRDEEEDALPEPSEIVDMGTHTVAVTHLADGFKKPAKEDEDDNEDGDKGENAGRNSAKLSS
jgi:hypothetical protein